MLATAYMAFDEAAERVISKVTFRHRVAVRLRLRGQRRGLLRGAFQEFRTRGEKPDEAPDLGDDDGSDTPLLDFWRWIIESGKIQAFMSFLVNEFLPKLFEIIIMIIEALSNVSADAIAVKVAGQFAVLDKAAAA